jgi:hypothetical protein
MRIALGKVVSGKVVVEGEPLDDGTEVVILARVADDEGSEVTAEQKSALLKSLDQAKRGELVDAAEVLRRLGGSRRA